ncbi:uncharacterized protein LOC114252032 [Bombyx mandarina]|uniref:Uncharacterized protein LOC114252032 n=1 Tax=Bombyx mandarina TaxID=7092 RepID=A0A6J2KIZ4_BOMMA|nr:uncharacterized protein LOC114252032 [Bombyx mandarina]
MIEDTEIAALSTTGKIDPTEFDVTIAALLTGLGATKYIKIFKKHNIGQSTLIELTNEDLIKLGLDDDDIRKKLLEEIKNLPIYEEFSIESRNDFGISPTEIADILEASSEHLYRIYLSIMANTLALKKTKNITDCLIYRDQYASNMAQAVLSELTTILNSMEIALHTRLKVLTSDTKKRKNKKIIVGVTGSIVIAILTAFFVQSLKRL